VIGEGAALAGPRIGPMISAGSRPSVAVYHRVPLLLGFALLAVSLAVLYGLNVVLPGAIGSSLWVLTSVLCVLTFRAHRIPLLSLSSVSVVFYLYICVALLWPVLFPQIFIAVHSTSFQTPEIFAKANHLAAVGLASLVAGWLLGLQLVAWRRPPSRPRVAFPVRPGSFVFILLLALPMLVLAFPTESIFTVGYNGAANENTIGAALEINVLKPGVIISSLLSLMALLQRPSRLRWVVWGIFVSVLIVVLGFASGDRVEEVGCIVAAGWLVLSNRTDHRTPKTWILAAVGLCLFLLVLGEIRSALPSQPLETSSLRSALDRSLDLIPSGQSGRMRPTTNGDAALTFCVVIGLVDTEVLHIDYGKTFLQYLDMTLPRFMNSDRPIELQVLLQRLSLTGGGLYVLAEPYLAGGAFGILLVLGFFGLMIGTLEALYLSSRLVPIAYFLYALLLSCVPRWFQYSILSMYKHVLTGLLILAVVKAWEVVFPGRVLLPNPTRDVRWQT
jgi:hypothetical protein